MNKKIIIAAAVLILIFIVTIVFSKKQTPAENPAPKDASVVSVQKVRDSTSLLQIVEYPAIIAGDQQISLGANSSGIITGLNFDLGDKIFQGNQLAVIDEIGNNSGVGDNGLKSSSIQALELAEKSAEERYKLAKRNYEDDDSYANKKAKELAKIDLEAAKVSLNGALNSHFVTSPITGTVTQKLVSNGDAVVAGQKIAMISKTALTKIQFFVDREEYSNFKIGTEIKINEDGKTIPGKIINIAPEADPVTKRFLIEAEPSEKNALLIGSLINVSLELTKFPTAPGNLLLPLSAITIGQNESNIFIAENERAKKINIEIQKVQGEHAEIKTDLPLDAEIIMKGSKLVQDGDEISIQK